MFNPISVSVFAIFNTAWNIHWFNRRLWILLFLLVSSVSGATERFSLKGSVFDTVAARHGIDPLLLYSIAIAESAIGVGGGYIRPTPYVFRSSSGPRYFSSRQEAEVALASALKYTENIDVGMMQINLRYHPQPNPLSLLEPHYNLTVAARYLKDTLASTDDPVIGVGRYHSWTDSLARWYGERVWQIYSNLQRASP